MIPFLNVGWQSLPDYSLSERYADVLSVINNKDMTVFIFDVNGFRLRTYVFSSAFFQFSSVFGGNE